MSSMCTMKCVICSECTSMYMLVHLHACTCIIVTFHMIQFIVLVIVQNFLHQVKLSHHYVTTLKLTLGTF